jgi:hypothetical protein
MAHNKWPVRWSVCGGGERVSYLVAWQDVEVQAVRRRRRPPTRSRPPPAGSMRGGRRGSCASSCPGRQAEELPRAWCNLQRDDRGECSSVARKRLPPGALFTWAAGSEQPQRQENEQSGGQSLIFALWKRLTQSACSWHGIDKILGVWEVLLKLSRIMESKVGWNSGHN